MDDDEAQTLITAICPLMSKVISFKEPKKVKMTRDEAQECYGMSLEDAKKEGYTCAHIQMERVQHLIKQPCVGRECQFWVELKGEIAWKGCAIVSMAHDLDEERREGPCDDR